MVREGRLDFSNANCHSTPSVPQSTRYGWGTQAFWVEREKRIYGWATGRVVAGEERDKAVLELFEAGAEAAVAPEKTRQS
jgi:hypothetical protein